MKKKLLALILIVVVIGAAAIFVLVGNQPKTLLPTDAFSVDSAGKVLATSDGKVTIEVPTDALINQTDISIKPIQDAEVTNYTVVSAYQLGPEGTCFLKPATLRIKYDPSTLPSEVNESDLRLYVQLAAGIVELGDSHVDLDNHSVSGQVFHFSSVLAAVSNSKSHSSVPNIVGRWNRLDGIDKYTFYETDHSTVTWMGDTYKWGKWEYNGPSGYDYILRWEHSPPNPTNGTFVDWIFIADDNQSYVGYNNYGASIHCVRASAPSEAQIKATAPDGFKVGKVITLTSSTTYLNAWEQGQDLQKVHWTVYSPDGTPVLISDATARQTKFTPKIPGDYVVDLFVDDNLGAVYDVYRGLTIMPDVDISVDVKEGPYGPDLNWKVTNNGQFPVNIDTVAGLEGSYAQGDIQVGHDYGNWANSFSILPGKTENILQPTGNEFLPKGTVDSVTWCAQVNYQHKSYPYWLIYAQNPESDISSNYPEDFGNSRLYRSGWFDVEIYASWVGGIPIGKWVP